MSSPSPTSHSANLRKGWRCDLFVISHFILTCYNATSESLRHRCQAPRGKRGKMVLACWCAGLVESWRVRAGENRKSEGWMTVWAVSLAVPSNNSLSAVPPLWHGHGFRPDGTADRPLFLMRHNEATSWGWSSVQNMATGSCSFVRTFANRSLPGSRAMGYSTLRTRMPIPNWQASRWLAGFVPNVYRTTSYHPMERQSLKAMISLTARTRFIGPCVQDASKTGAPKALAKEVLHNQRLKLTGASIGEEAKGDSVDCCPHWCRGRK